MAPNEQEVQNRGVSTGSPTAMGMAATPSAPPTEISTTDPLNGLDDQTIKTMLQDVLDGADVSKPDLQKLQKYIEFLQVKSREDDTIQQDTAPPRSQVIYRIRRDEVVHDHTGSKTVEKYLPFFDHPEWVKGQGTASRIQSSLPLQNLDLYLEKNKDVAFIVYRTFDLDTTGIAAKPGIDGATRDTAAHLPQYSSESIRPVNIDLIEAIKALLGSRQEYIEILREFSTSYELAAPYLFIYHSRNSLEGFINNLPLPAKAQLSLLFKFVTEAYTDEYAAADSLLSHGKISPGHVRYLFKPGDLLMSRVNGQYMGYISTSWPEINCNKKISRMHANRSSHGTGHSLYGSQEADARMATDKSAIDVYRFKAWRWAFDGNFQRIHECLEMELPRIEDGQNATDIKGKTTVATQGKEHRPPLEERDISDLNVFPMQYASAELVDKCRRRGKTFWKCRSRNYVSYQVSELESIQNLVSAFVIYGIDGRESNQHSR